MLFPTNKQTQIFFLIYLTEMYWILKTYNVSGQQLKELYLIKSNFAVSYHFFKAKQLYQVSIFKLIDLTCVKFK